MTSFLKLFALALGMVGLMILVLYVVFSDVNSSLQSPAPTDKTLEANFRSHKPALETLLEMSRADPTVIRIAHDFTWLDTDSSWPRPEEKLGFSLERLKQYRQLFHKASLERGILQDNKNGLTYFIYWSRGLMTNGSSKGYAYSETALTPIVSSLDDYNSLPEGKRVIFKKLEGDWYLFWMSS